MAITKQKKEEIIKNLTEKGKDASSVVFANFHGLDVVSTVQLRKSLRSVGVDFVVAKKTLIKKVFASLKFVGDMPELEGEVAIAFGKKDEVAPAKEISAFAKTHKGMIKILGGILEGRYIGEADTVALADIPSREVLYGKFVNVINSPVQGLVGALQGNMRNLVIVLDKIKDKK